MRVMTSVFTYEWRDVSPEQMECEFVMAWISINDVISAINQSVARVDSTCGHRSAPDTPGIKI